jgi:hypothetical protein
VNENIMIDGVDDLGAYWFGRLAGVVNEAGYEAEDLLQEAHKYLGRKRYRQLEDACSPSSLLQESINGMID